MSRKYDEQFRVVFDGTSTIDGNAGSKSQRDRFPFARSEEVSFTVGLLTPAAVGLATLF